MHVSRGIITQLLFFIVDLPILWRHYCVKWNQPLKATTAISGLMHLWLKGVPGGPEETGLWLTLNSGYVFSVSKILCNVSLGWTKSTMLFCCLPVYGFLPYSAVDFSALFYHSSLLVMLIVQTRDKRAAAQKISPAQLIQLEIKESHCMAVWCACLFKLLRFQKGKKKLLFQ